MTLLGRKASIRMILIHECILLGFSDEYTILQISVNVSCQPPSFFCIVTSGR